MKNAIAWAAAVAFVSGCAIPPASAIDRNLSPERIVQSLNGRALTARGDGDAVYGIAPIKEFLQPAITRCAADGGALVVLARAEVRFAPKVQTGTGPQRAALHLPTKVGCRVNGTLAWGGTLGYDKPMFFVSSWAQSTYYYATTATAFVPAAQLEWTESNSSANLEATRARNEECTALRQVMTERLRSRPEVGMNVGSGVVIDVRLPLVLVQYNALGRQLKGREEEWVPATSLVAGYECPR
ncbi:MAG: hypothetical protein K8R60_03845 [Burkholderiales bacterium]|nr:hypothetical protein [Burkholderiales bacterium]